MPFLGKKIRKKRREKGRARINFRRQWTSSCSTNGGETTLNVSAIIDLVTDNFFTEIDANFMSSQSIIFLDIILKRFSIV